jgi:hypothetical protein
MCVRTHPSCVALLVVGRTGPVREELTLARALLRAPLCAMRLLVKNEGSTDRAVRVVIGVVLLAMVFVGPKTPWGLVGLVPLVTGLVGMCPLYRLFGLSTCPVRR